MRPGGRVYRTSPRDSWAWMRFDLALRIVPLTLAPLVFARLTQTPLSRYGLTLAHPGRDLLLAIPLAAIGLAVAAGFADDLARRRGRWYVPDPPDLALQSLYYLAINAPVEEWFFRGFLQGQLALRWNSPAVAVLTATAIFGGYHLLDRWGWLPVAGATVAGLALGLVYLWQPSPPSLLTPVLIHAAITCGFLSLGPYAVFRWRLAGGRITPAAEPTQVAQ